MTKNKNAQHPDMRDVMDISLKPMTKKLCREYYSDFEADPIIYMDMSLFKEFTYSHDWADMYYNRQSEKQRIFLAIMHHDLPIGEVILKNIDMDKQECTLSIHLQNNKVKGKGFGTQAIILALDYAFKELEMLIVNADAVIKNERSQHILEKVGFKFLRRDEVFCYYRFLARDYLD